MTVKYTKDHEWIRFDDSGATIGISAHAAEQLGDVVFVELPEIGKTFAKGDDMAVVESVKAASDVYAPIDGEVTAVNDALEGDPGLVNSGAEGEGWLWSMTVGDESQLESLMSLDDYKKTIG